MSAEFSDCMQERRVHPAEQYSCRWKVVEQKMNWAEPLAGESTNSKISCSDRFAYASDGALVLLSLGARFRQIDK